uniref:Ig-like domain-containing protein n=1 Tax=Maylandia zebra TaxID=106582 RepID=A0A3P9C5C8_9CICH
APLIFLPIPFCATLMCLCVLTQPEASSWTAAVSSSVKGLLGSCVVIPCSYNYPDPKTNTTSFTGIWYNDNDQVVYHSDASQTPGQFRNRTKLLGDLSKKNCSLMIDDLQQSDVGPLYFRIEIKGYDQYSYKNNKVSISVSQPDLSVQEEVKEGENVSASCSVFHSCPTYPPSFIWSHFGEQQNQTQQLHEGQWNSTSTLTFRPNRSDHNKPLKCRVTYHRGLHLETSKILQVKCKYTTDLWSSLIVPHKKGFNSSLLFENKQILLMIKYDLRRYAIRFNLYLLHSFSRKNRCNDIPCPDMYNNPPVYGNVGISNVSFISSFILCMHEKGSELILFLCAD